MLGKKLLEFPPLHEGVLLKRYKRFLADVKLDSGKVVTAHCANTGPMKGVLIPNGRVRLRYAPSPSRKLSWTWEQSEVFGVKGQPCWVGVNTSLANTLVKLSIESGCFQEEFGDIAEIRQEVVYGINRRSRIDFLVYPSKQSVNSRSIYIEVKNTTWVKDSCALFPDTITKRGQKHLLELISVIPDSRAVLVPCISRDDVDIFAPGDSADKEYGNLYRKAVSKGVEVLPCSFGFYADCITWEGKKRFIKRQVFG